MFQEVSQTSLIVFLSDGAYVLGDVKVCPVFGLIVVTDIVGQSVTQFPVSNLWVDRKRFGFLHLLCHHLCESDETKQDCR